METILLIIQAVLAVVFGITGMVKAIVPIHNLKEKMPWANRFSASTVRLVGFSEIFASIGLILPMLMEVGDFMIPIAASGLVVIQLLALFDHISHKESKPLMLNIFLFLMATFVIVATLFLK